MMYVGILFFLVSPLFYFFSRRSEKLAGLIGQTQLMPIAQLQPNSMAEVYGTTTVAQPLRTPFSQQPCVYFEYDVRQEIQKRDAQGRTSSSWETVSSDKQSMPFWVQDQTGNVAVYPDGATIDAENISDRDLGGNEMTGWSGHLTAGATLMGSRLRVRERGLLVNKPLFAYGSVGATDQGLALVKGNGEMYLSHRTRADVQTSLARSQKLLFILAILFCVIGIGLTVFGIVHT